jgi:hypothetical protein
VTFIGRNRSASDPATLTSPRRSTKPGIANYAEGTTESVLLISKVNVDFESETCELMDNGLLLSPTQLKRRGRPRRGRAQSVPSIDGTDDGAVGVLDTSENGVEIADSTSPSVDEHSFGGEISYTNNSVYASEDTVAEDTLNTSTSAYDISVMEASTRGAEGCDTSLMMRTSLQSSDFDHSMLECDFLVGFESEALIEQDMMTSCL